MSTEQLFRQPPATVCPSPPPSQPMRFDGRAYPTPKDHKTSGWVWREPVRQRALIEARNGRRNPSKKPEVPEPEEKSALAEEPEERPGQNPNVFAYNDAYYARVCREDKEKRDAAAAAEKEQRQQHPSVTPAEVPADTVAKKQVPVVEAGSPTPKQIKAGAKKGRKATTQERGKITSSATRVIISSGRDKAKTGKGQLIAAKKENKRPLVSLEITEALLNAVAKTALDRFKSPRIAEVRRTIVSLADLLLPQAGHGESRLLAEMVRKMREAIANASNEERIVDRRFLHAVASKTLGELVKTAWEMMSDEKSRDVSDDPDVRKRVGANRQRSGLSTNAFRIRRHVIKGGREVFFILIVMKSGRKTLESVVFKKR